MNTCSMCISHKIPKRDTRKEGLWGFVKGSVYVPLLPKDMDKLNA